jgi:hypothetical protein
LAAFNSRYESFACASLDQNVLCVHAKSKTDTAVVDSTDNFAVTIKIATDGLVPQSFEDLAEADWRNVFGSDEIEWELNPNIKSTISPVSIVLLGRVELFFEELAFVEVGVFAV